jgi:hypothetical protein
MLHLHDIFLPWDYPEEWRSRYYSEQYLLACWLLANGDKLRLVLSNSLVSFEPTLCLTLRTSFTDSPLARLLEGKSSHASVSGLLGSSFWAEVG